MGLWSRLFGRKASRGSEPKPVPEPPPALARDPELEAAIEAALAHGDARDELAVYADWLSTQGDPRGELITLQLQAEHRVSEWEREHHPVTIEAPRVPTGTLAAEASKRIESRRRQFYGALDAGHRVEWRDGYWYRLRYHPFDKPEAKARLADALAHPSARFLRGLWIGTALGDPVMDVVPGTIPTTVRELYLGDFDFPLESELSWTVIGDVSPIYDRVPQLERLVLQGAEMAFGPRVELPQLRSLEVISTQLPDAAIRAIAASSLPELESLVLWTGGQPGAIHSDPLPLLGGTFPKLRRLGIVNCADTDKFVEALVKTPLAAQLTSLDLRLGRLTDSGARAIDDARDRMRLELLDVSENHLLEVVPPEMFARLAQQVIVGNQRADDGERYPQILE